ncbi:diacylglycerol kinase [Tabrizicola aquatica]|uniref:diacylglycerol kinase n=1 Tax=Tabrizicola aquatica TaxID=909926 RepID=UPI000CD1AAE4|nr:diacylglycerol kinase [Tabrizicola aquatica]
MGDMLRAEARRLANTVIWSWAGFRAAWATEKTLRQWTLANVLSASLALTLDLSPAERALILALGLLVLAAELINTAIEEVVDHISPGLDPRAKKAKDCGSACVALTALAAGVAWAVVLVGQT